MRTFVCAGDVRLALFLELEMNLSIVFEILGDIKKSRLFFMILLSLKLAFVTSILILGDVEKS